MCSKAKRKSQKLSPSADLAKNQPRVFSPIKSHGFFDCIKGRKKERKEERKKELDVKPFSYEQSKPILELNIYIP